MLLSGVLHSNKFATAANYINIACKMIGTFVIKVPHGHSIVFPNKLFELNIIHITTLIWFCFEIDD